MPMRIRLGRRKVWSPIRDTLCFRAGEPPASAPRVNVPKEQENQNQASKILTCAKPPAPAPGGEPTARCLSATSPLTSASGAIPNQP